MSDSKSTKGVCYVRVSTYNDNSITYLPSYPDDISDSTSSNWSDENIIGRSSPMSAYTGTGYRGVSFSFLLHREMDGDIEAGLKAIRSSLYPSYLSAGLNPPITVFRFGDFYVKGIVRSVQYVWQKPIIRSEYQVCNVSVSIDTTPSKVMSATDLGRSLNPMGTYS